MKDIYPLSFSSKPRIKEIHASFFFYLSRSKVRFFIAAQIGREIALINDWLRQFIIFYSMVLLPHCNVRGVPRITYELADFFSLEIFN